MPMTISTGAPTTNTSFGVCDSPNAVDAFRGVGDGNDEVRGTRLGSTSVPVVQR